MFVRLKKSCAKEQKEKKNKTYKLARHLFFFQFTFFACMHACIITWQWVSSFTGGSFAQHEIWNSNVDCWASTNVFPLVHHPSFLFPFVVCYCKICNHSGKRQVCVVGEQNQNKTSQKISGGLITKPECLPGLLSLAHLSSIKKIRMLISSTIHWVRFNTTYFLKYIFLHVEYWTREEPNHN